MRPSDEWDGTVLSQRRQLVTLGFLMLAGVLNYLDRASLSIANPVIRGEMSLSGTQMGGLLAVFSLAYGIGQIPAGTLVKRFGFRSVLGGSMFAWSAAQVMTALVRSYPAFQALRAVLGLGESPFFPATLDAVQSSFAPERRGRAMGLVNTSTILGQALAPPALTVLMLWAGWRGMFAVIGVAGLVFATIWLAFGAKRSAHVADKTDLVGKDAASFALRELFADPDLLALLRTRTMIGMMLGFGGINYTAWLYLTWLPGYLASEYHLKLGPTGMISGIPFAAGAVGMLASGILTDLKVRDRKQSMAYRRHLIVIGMVLSAGCTALVVRATSLPMAVAAISMAVLFIHFAGTAAWNLIHVSSPARLSAQVGALQSMGSYAIASAGPVITGWLLDRTHSFHIALLICSCVTTAGAVAYLTMTLKPIVIEGYEENEPLTRRDIRSGHSV
jgi:MFS transporter, ACS family, L-galactonate transporter